MTTTPTTHAAMAAERARAWLQGNPIFLDTETTGLETTDEIVDLAVIDSGGGVLLNTLVRPMQHILITAYAIHGIADADVASAPTFAELLPSLAHMLAGRRVIIYNADFDSRMLRQSAAAHNLALGFNCAWFDAMDLYAKFFGDWNARRGSFRWQRLDAAAEQCGLVWPSASHRALPDAQMCRQIVRHMADQVPAVPTETQPRLM